MPQAFQNCVGALAHELGAIRDVSPLPDTEDRLRAEADRLQLSALCLSGGGVRSASFCLGVLQTLARAGLLKQFDYLSTVSGGGYIGSFLQLLIGRLGVAGAEVALGGPVASDALKALRNDTNYLSPGGDLFSLNTWAGLVLYVRNVLLNFAVYLPLILLPVQLAILARTSVWAIAHSLAAKSVFLALSGLALAFATFGTATSLPDHRQNRNDAAIAYASQSTINRWIFWPALFYAAFASFSLGRMEGWDTPLLSLLSVVGAYALGLSAGYVAAWINAGRKSDVAFRLYWRNAGAWLFATAASTGIVCLGWWLLRFVGASQEAQVITVAGPLWFLIALSIHSTVFVGVRKESDFFDLDREWLARLNAMKLRAGLVWGLFCFACLSITWFLAVRGDTGSWAAWIASGGAGGSGGLAAWLGQQAKAKVGALVSEPDKLQQPYLNTLLPLLSGIFILGFIAALGRIADLTDGAAQTSWQALGPKWFIPNVPLPVFIVPTLFAILLCWLVWFINRRVNVNRYSMHAVYRNRLSRAFLGSARRDRHPDPFTDFDPGDNIPLKTLAAEQGHRKLFPVPEPHAESDSGRGRSLVGTDGHGLHRDAARLRGAVIAPVHSGAARATSGRLLADRPVRRSRKSRRPNPSQWPESRDGNDDFRRCGQPELGLPFLSADGLRDDAVQRAPGRLATQPGS